MDKRYIKIIADKMGIKEWQVEHTVELLEDGATVPFISRYRKERTGQLNEVEITEIKSYWNRFIELDKRKESVIKSIEDQGKLTDELSALIDNCIDMQTLEDIYLPYKPKRKTKASVAREKGLEPLADKMLTFNVPNFRSFVNSFCNESVPTAEDALEGARYIIAERVSENAAIRKELRNQYINRGILSSKLVKGKEDEGEKFENYFSFSGDISRMPAHRVLAVLRGVEEGILRVSIDANDEICKKIVNKYLYNGERCNTFELFKQIDEAVDDSLKRLLHPSIENETLSFVKQRADVDSIRVFEENLRQLLLAAPVGQKRTLAIDPGFRTGCKVVCLNENGDLLHNDTIYPHPPVNEKVLAMKKLSNMIESYKIEIIAIGNGTASRETEAFVKRLALPEGVKVYSVSEDGASIYSASPVAREEFPDYDVTVRGAVSIGRRLMDPLAELVKIDPKSLGVGQYQHDVDQSLLKDKLDDVVVSCVNSVGVNLNTASSHLLSYVSGIGPVLAKNIVEYRAENGAFASRQDLLNVKRLGAKVFEQAAGFLRIPDAQNPLDNSAVHPEQYNLVEKIVSDKGVSVDEIIGNKDMLDSIDIKSYVTDTVGLPTLNDIISELSKPGRDPRSNYKVLEFANDIHTIEDLKIGMELPGIVTNITNFGAFVDFGIKQNGLIHISQMSDKRVTDPTKIVKLHQHVKVRIIEIDTKRNRIQLKLL